MNKKDIIKKSWVKPSVRMLSIKKDTFSGSVTKAESQGGSAQVPKDPTPR